MSTKSNAFNDAENTPNMVGQVTEVASEVKRKVSDLGRSAVDKVEENRQAAASGLESAAATLHENAESLPGGDKVTGMAHATANKLNATADYVREHDVNNMMSDLEQVVKNNPGPALLAAAVVGFLIGRAFSHD
jgi:ElaB/YqjD/DUF883 family membrane-anchored ribosome-binding protein